MFSSFVDILLERFSRWAFLRHDVVIRLMFSPSAQAIHLILLFVDEGSRGQGRSSLVLRRLQKLAKFLRLNIFLHPKPVDDTMSQAELVKFYEKRGFTPAADDYCIWCAVR